MSKKKERLVTDVNGNELFTDDWIKIVESIEIDCQEVFLKPLIKAKN